jgi:hypothetical protein
MVLPVQGFGTLVKHGAELRSVSVLTLDAFQKKTAASRSTDWSDWNRVKSEVVRSGAACVQNDTPLRQVKHRNSKRWTNLHFSRITRLAAGLAICVSAPP